MRDELTTKILRNEHTKLKEELKLHQDAADRAYKAKSKDKVKSKNDLGYRVLVFDMQQSLPTPHLTSKTSNSCGP
jgi:hypothetical protein